MQFNIMGYRHKVGCIIAIMWVFLSQLVAGRQNRRVIVKIYQLFRHPLFNGIMRLKGFGTCLFQ